METWHLRIFAKIEYLRTFETITFNNYFLINKCNATIAIGSIAIGAFILKGLIY